MDLLINKFSINIVILLIVLTISSIFILKLKNVTKGYKILFLCYTFFWIPLKMLRDFTSPLQTGIDSQITWLPLMMYGLIGIFIRPISDFLSLRLKNRKIVLYLAIFFGIVCSIPVCITQTTTTNVIQSLGVGIGASMIGIYELMFKEQYTKNKSFLTVSIMAFPPLIADFFSAPFQSIVLIISNKDKINQIDAHSLSYLWIIAIIFYIITAVILFFVKEDRSLIGIVNNKEINVNSYSSISFITLLCLVGFFISFIKFSNSGSIATLTLQKLLSENQISDDYMLAYISTIFSLSQLFGTMFLGMFLIKKTNKLNAFSLGIGIWILFQLIISFNNNPYLYFASSALNGFAYGVLYNLVLAYVLTLSFKNQKITPMGVYQAILSIGITTSTTLVSFLKTSINNFNNANMYINISLMIGMIILELLFLLTYKMDNKVFNNINKNH